MGQGQSRESSMGLESMTDIQARDDQVGNNTGVRTGRSLMYFKSKDSMCLGSGLTVGCAKERGANGYYKNFSLSISKMEVLFSRWLARGADCQGGREERRGGGLKKGEELGAHVQTSSA